LAIRRHGFTLVEILIVVIILGILAAIVMANVGGATEDSRRGAFVSSLKTFVHLEAGFRAETGNYLEDASSGVCPAGFERFIYPGDWESGTPIGGVWDSQRDEDGIVSAIGVHFSGAGITRDDDYMITVDRIFDDGDLATGGFRKLNVGRYYFVIAE
jgi:prepilin-type N-terminal cleavage/methylation domain-containing protein